MLKIIEARLGIAEMYEPMRSELIERMHGWVVCSLCAILFLVIALGCNF